MSYNDHYEDDYEPWEEYICGSGFCMDECCNCIDMDGFEECEFHCPFGGIPRCGESRAAECREISRISTAEMEQEYQFNEIIKILEMGDKK